MSASRGVLPPRGFLSPLIQAVHGHDCWYGKMEARVHKRAAGCCLSRELGDEVVQGVAESRYHHQGV